MWQDGSLIKQSTNNIAGEGVEKTEPSYTVGGMYIGATTMGNSMEVTQKFKNRVAI